MWPGLRPEFTKPAEWDQLLARLGLSDSQALEAIESGGETGEQLRKFALKAFRFCFVPEAVIHAVRRTRANTHAIPLSADSPTGISSAIVVVSGERL
jgi:hypothetical protein